MLRSVIALIAGFAIMTFLILVVTIVVAMMTDVDSTSPTVRFLEIKFAYSAVAALFGGYATAALAPGRPMVHAAVLAMMVLLLGASNVASPPSGHSAPYLVALMVACPVAAISGGWLRTLRKTASPSG